MSATPPGWYPDMQDSARERLWDGEKWTDLTRDAQPSDPAPTSVAGSSLAEPVSSPQRERGRSPAGLVIAIALIAVAIVGFVAYRMQVDQAARDEANRGANIGGTPNSLDTMYDLLCPQGAATDTSGTGVNCTNAP